MTRLASWWHMVRARRELQRWVRRDYPPALARARQHLAELRAGRL